MIRRLIDMILRRPAPPNDERSIRAEQIADLRDEQRRQSNQIARIRQEAAWAEQRVMRRR